MFEEKKEEEKKKGLDIKDWVQLVGVMVAILVAGTTLLSLSGKVPSWWFDFSLILLIARAREIGALFMTGIGAVMIIFGLGEMIYGSLTTEGEKSTEDTVSAYNKWKEGAKTEKGILVKVRCPKCSHLNDEDNMFCGNCGESLIKKEWTFSRKRKQQGEEQKE